MASPLKPVCLGTPMYKICVNDRLPRSVTAGSLSPFCTPVFYAYKCKNGFFSNWHDMNPQHKEIEKI